MVMRNDVDQDDAGSGFAAMSPAAVSSAAASRTAETCWSWPPYAPWEPVDGVRFRIEDWAPPSSVRRPWVRVGRWTLLYRRAA
jgi:hypothetical protein